MSDILFIKTSSLGDVIHHMPAVTDARRHRPDARIGWVVEEAFAPLVRLHRAVESVIPVASRRWRRAPFSPATWREIGAFKRAMREQTHETVIDAQGLVRSALIARFARGRRHGYDRDSVRERAASWFYDVRHRVDRSLHAITRNRMLTGAVLGYAPRRRARFRARPRGADGRRGDARRHPAARDRAAGEGMAGRALDRARSGARRERLRDRAAVGHAKPSGGAASRSPPPCRTRRCPSASRSMRSRA